MLTEKMWLGKYTLVVVFSTIAAFMEMRQKGAICPRLPQGQLTALVLNRIGCAAII